MKNVAELRSSIAEFMRYYNNERPPQSLELLLPAKEYAIVVTAEAQRFYKGIR